MMSKHRRTKICNYCNKIFITKISHQLTCSKECSVKRNNRVKSEYKKLWSKENRENVRKSQQKWIENNPEKRKEASSSYMKRNRAYYSEYISIRRRNAKRATPIWADKEALLDIYKEAQYQQLEVDHIIPLKHKLVCGLHVPANLQLLSREENAKKSNRFEVLDEDLQAIILEEE